MERRLALECVRCGRQFDVGDGRGSCPDHEDGGALEYVIDADWAKEAVDLPDDPISSVWQYGDLLPVSRGVEPVTLAEGGTPLVSADRVGAELGVDLSLKLESANPTGSTKDRGSTVVATYAVANEYRGLVCASTGNAAASIASYAARTDLDCLVFVPASTPRAKATQPLVAGAEVVAVDGTYGDALSLARSVGRSDAWIDRSAGATPFAETGSRTLGYELGQGVPSADWVVVPMGNGGTITGVWNGLSLLRRMGTLDRTPKLLGVQAASVDPIVSAFEGSNGSDVDGSDVDGNDADGNDADGSDAEVSASDASAADSIDVPEPREAASAVAALRSSDGAAVRVSEADIVTAQRQLGALEGVFAEPASATTLAGLESARDEGIVRSDESVVLVVTGSGLKDAEAAGRAAPTRRTVSPDVDREELEGRLDADL